MQNVSGFLGEHYFSIIFQLYFEMVAKRFSFWDGSPYFFVLSGGMGFYYGISPFEKLVCVELCSLGI